MMKEGAAAVEDARLPLMALRRWEADCFERMAFAASGRVQFMKVRC